MVIWYLVIITLKFHYATKPIAYSTKGVNPNVAKRPLKYKDSSAKHGLTPSKISHRPEECPHWGLEWRKCSNGKCCHDNISCHHDDVIKWKHFPCYWPFVWGIHRSPVNSPHKGQQHEALMFSLICALNKWLSKQPWGWWFKMPPSSLWRHCNVMWLQVFLALRHMSVESITVALWMRAFHLILTKQLYQNQC